MNPENSIKDGVYYDAETGIFCFFDERTDRVLQKNATTGKTVHTFDKNQFSEAVQKGDFYKIDDSVVNNPETYLKEYIQSTLNQSLSPNNFDEIAVEYALNVVSMNDTSPKKTWE